MFGIKKEINVKAENLKQYQLFERNPSYFFQECLEGFDFDKFDKRALALSKSNDIHLVGDRQAGTTTTMVLTLLHKLIFNRDRTFIYISGANFHQTDNIFRILEDGLRSVSDKCDFLNMNDITKSRTKNSIELINGNKIIRIGAGNFIDKTRGIAADFIIALDECKWFKPDRISNINECINLYLKPHSKVARLYGN